MIETRMTNGSRGSRLAAAAGLLTLPLLLAACELGPKETQQLGPPGAAMEQVTNLNLVRPVSAPPPSAYELTTREGQRAREVYPELKELGDISVEEFGLLMANITEWVVPKDAPPEEAGCNYCHNPENMASYEKYTKTVALKMIQMTRSINVDYKSHVQQTGVTCYTCHRGMAVPAYNWSFREDAGERTTIMGNKRGQNTPDPVVAYASLPYDVFGPHLADDPRNIRVNTPQIHPTAQSRLIGTKEAEKTYGLMMHMASSLGVNCTYCHNSDNFANWTNSRVQMVGAWHGIRMVRTSNNQYMTPLEDVFPRNAGRHGPLGDVLKVNCMTCHQGVNKPLGGYSMLKDNPSLAERPLLVAAPAPAPVVAGAVLTVPGVGSKAVAVVVPSRTVAAVQAARAATPAS